MFFSALLQAEAFRQFSRYLIVGGAGFLIDVAVMETLLRGGMHIMAARVCSMCFAMVVGYLLHRGITFRATASAASRRQFSLYVLCQLTAAVFNYGLFALVLYALMPQPPGFSARLFALCCGTGIGLLFNFSLLRYVVFAGGERKFREDLKKLKAFIILHKRLWIWTAVFAVFALLSLERHLEVLAYPDLTHPLGPQETDVWMRLSQVRHWMGGAGFFDHRVTGTNAPFGGIESHWTRPMDFLIVIFSYLVPHAEGAGLDLRLLLAAAWLPSALFFLALAFLTGAGMRLLNSGHVLLATALLLIFNPITFNYFDQGNVDHHGLLIALWCGVLFCMMRPLNGATAVFGGVLLGLMIWIGLEALVVMALAFGALGLYVVFRRPAEMPLLALMAWAMALTLTGAIFCEIPAARIVGTVIYDNLSIVYLTVVYAIAVGALILAGAFKCGLSLPSRLAAVGVVFAAAAAVVLHFYPDLLQGPLVNVHDYVRKHFMKNVREVMPLAKLGPTAVILRLYAPLVALGLLVMIVSDKSLRESRRRAALVLLALLPPAIALVFYQVRWNYYLQPVAILVIATFFPAIAIGARGRLFSWLRHLPRHSRPHCWIWIFLFLLSVLIVMMPAEKEKEPERLGSTCAIHIYQAIQSGSLEKELGPGNLVLMVHPNFAGDVQFFTPYRVIAGNYHREGAGMVDARKAYAGQYPSITFSVIRKRKIDAIYICPSDVHKTGWLSKLKPGSETPPWMTEVTGIAYMPELSAAAEAKKKESEAEAAEKDARYNMPLLYKVRRRR